MNAQRKIMKQIHKKETMTGINLINIYKATGLHIHGYHYH